MPRDVWLRKSCFLHEALEALFAGLADGADFRRFFPGAKIAADAAAPHGLA